MRLLWTALPGVCVLVFAFTEIFQDLFHPAQTGSLSDWVGRTTFRLFRRWPSMLSTAGPLTIVFVIICWAFLQALGFALIYWAAFPAGFQQQSPEHVTGIRGLWIMLYFSVQVMTTLGLGDLLPTAGWIRLLVSFQALAGFALLTASVSSIVLIYPALARMRCLARRTEVVLLAARNTGVDLVSGRAEYLLSGFAADVIRTRVDFIHFPVIYYFHSDHRRSSLAHTLPDLLRLADKGSDANIPEPVRLASTTLRIALEDLAQILSRRFIHADTEDPSVVFRAYADAHLVPRRNRAKRKQYRSPS